MTQAVDQINDILRLLNDLDTEIDKFFSSMQQSCSVRYTKTDIDGDLQALLKMRQDIESKVKEYGLNCVPLDWPKNAKEKDLLAGIKQEASVLRTNNTKLQDSCSTIHNIVANQRTV
ncbi:hypothetical protein TrispH2_007375 [Trichoplax sp. H2]|uniref:Uncharacterized protein n=1 Tax=Trichoplax adhaerens TaxID=10228 RepID=B3S4T2_TRIAD|nr:predicted protein [Trichoplax adhaerens]EDV22140.1 predicted protein [Trichoplax adhaerens]RDD41472.1 hypothetical protein TrispH2_007375 [Trichoplax sp. H2]|eukprot:XP_002115295.1 predicted protein [Trichoplax adhaerens]